jgi:hypothetical protein
MIPARKPPAPITDTGFHAMIRRIVAEELALIEAEYRRRELLAFADLCRSELVRRDTNPLIPTEGWTPWTP